MERLVGAAYVMFTTRSRADGDVVDRMNHRYTVYLLIIFSIIITTKLYTGDPVICWCPAEFTDNHLDFATRWCWVSDTYFVPFSQKDIPEPHENRKQIGYYQWVPLILLLQSLLFYSPVLFWRLASNRAGVEIHDLVEASRNLQRGCFYEDRPVILKCMVLHLDRYLTMVPNKKPSRIESCKELLAKRLFIFRGRYYGNYLTSMYLVMKIMHLVNVVVQFILLDVFLGAGYYFYGVRVIQRLIDTHDWDTSPRFPRVTLCDFDVRKLANIHTHTVQCVLQINLYNEFIFICVWFWLVFLVIITILNFIVWMYKAIAPMSSLNYVSYHLRSIVKNMSKDDKSHLPDFVDHHLKQDGVYMLRTIGSNGNDLVVAEMLQQFWLLYRSRKGLIPLTNSNAPLLVNGIGGHVSAV